MSARRGIVAIGALIAGAFGPLGAPAAGQTLDQLIGRFREECRAQLASELSRNPSKPDRDAKVSECMRAKFRDRAQRATTMVPARSELKLPEGSPWLVAKTRGPSEATGIIYFVRGYFSSTRNFQHIPYALKTLSEKGWDVLAANAPRDAAGLATDLVGPGAAFMRRRVSEFRTEGYKRVVLAGHSWGGWGAVLAAQSPELAADALLLSVPTVFGTRISDRDGKPNPNFSLLLSEFPRMIAKVRLPTVLILPDGDPYDPDPAKLGAVAEKHFGDAGIARLVIAKPPGFSGHLGGWLPIFDYAYGGCIAAFIESPASRSCLPPTLSDKDFRSVVGLSQVADAESKSLTSAEALAGRKFAIYALSDPVTRFYEYVSATQRKSSDVERSRSEGVTFRNGLHCAAGQCSKLLAWGDGLLLEFEPKSGNLFAWWVEQH